MYHSVPVSAGIEKFYTSVQFYTILLLTLSLVLTILLMVFIAIHSGKGKQKTLFLLWMISFALFQCAEAGLAVCPGNSTPGILPAVDLAGLFLFSRTFLLFSSALSTIESKTKFPLLLIGVEIFFYGFAALMGFSYFSILSPDIAILGSLGRLFVAEALGWIAAGAVLPLIDKQRPEGRDKNGGIFFSLGALSCIAALLLHHSLRFEYTALILPVGLTIAAFCWWRSCVGYNYLSLFLDSLEGVMAYIPMLVAVMDHDGRILSVEGNGPMILRDSVFKDLDDLIKKLDSCMPSGSDETLLLNLRERRFNELSSGRFTLRGPYGVVWLAWSVRPVRYRGTNVAWILTLQDVTKEELEIHEAARRQEEMALSYNRLRMYRKTELYREIEIEREKLLEDVYRSLDELTEDMASGIYQEDWTSSGPDLLNELIEEARLGLKEIRLSVHRLKKLQKEEME